MSTRLARSDEANTAVLLTSATPIMSAEALDDVRRGDRATLSRARTPGTLNSFATGHPISLVTGLATVDDRLAMPRNSSRAPVAGEPDESDRAARSDEQPDRGTTRSPTTVTITPATRRRVRNAANPSSGRIAATGGIFAARRAGTMTDSMVMPIPTSAAIRMVRGSMTISASGNPAPAASKRAMRPRATSRPPMRPNTVADHAEHERLERDQPSDLATGGSDCTQQCELSESLTDR